MNNNDNLYYEESGTIKDSTIRRVHEIMTMKNKNLHPDILEKEYEIKKECWLKYAHFDEVDDIKLLSSRQIDRDRLWDTVIITWMAVLFFGHLYLSQ